MSWSGRVKILFVLGGSGRVGSGRVHRRRSDWNAAGTHGGLTIKVLQAKKHIFIHCTNLVLKILQHDKIWGGDNPPLQILGDLSPTPWSTPMQASACSWVVTSCEILHVCDSDSDTAQCDSWRHPDISPAGWLLNTLAASDVYSCPSQAEIIDKLA